jgi:hypothetical protein
MKQYNRTIAPRNRRGCPRHGGSRMGRPLPTRTLISVEDLAGIPISSGNSVSCARRLEPRLGGFNPQGFRSLDYAIVSARTNDIRLVLGTLDDWDYFHGANGPTLNGEVSRNRRLKPSESSIGVSAVHYHRAPACRPRHRPSIPRRPDDHDIGNDSGGTT